MNPTAFKKGFDRDFQAFISAKVRSMGGLVKNDNVLAYVRAGEKVAISGGKRARPMMAEMVYEALGGKDKKAARQLGIGLELFHLFCLFHDDVIDGGQTRHGELTVHKSVFKNLKTGKRRGNLAHHANGQAVLVGDLFFGWAYECITSAAASVKNGSDVLAVFAKMIDEVIAGQMLDVDFMSQAKVSLENVGRKNLLKTATYSFVRPLELGITLAGGEKKLMREVSHFAAALGTAFQLQDDLMDVFADPKITGKPAMADIEDGAHTPLSAFVLAEASKKEQKIFLQFFGQGTLDGKEQRAVRELLVRTGAIAFAEEEMGRLFAHAEAVLKRGKMPLRVREVLTGLLEYIARRNT